jgi:hypothetical protein
MEGCTEVSRQLFSVNESDSYRKGAKLTKTRKEI